MPTQHVEIEPVNLSRIVGTDRGKLVEIGADVQGVALALHELDERFRLFYNPDRMLYILELHTPRDDGSVDEHFVGAYDELDHRIAQRAAQVMQPGYDLSAELEQVEREADAAQEYRVAEHSGDISERLSHALRKDLSRHEAASTLKSRAFIPRAFTPRS